MSTEKEPREVESIWDLKAAPWANEPRFYPPGQHPAMRRWREHLRALEEHGFGEHEAAVYAREWIAAFEQGESEAKAIYDRCIRDRRTQRDS